MKNIKKLLPLALILSLFFFFSFGLGFYCQVEEIYDTAFTKGMEYQVQYEIMRSRVNKEAGVYPEDK